MKKLLLLSLILTVPGLCAADVLPPTQKDLELFELAARRAKDGDYNYADQFCAGKSAGKPCVLPGNPLEGGGSGLCEVSGGISNDEVYVSSECRRTKEYVYDWGFSYADLKWKLPQDLCQSDPALVVNGATCDAGPLFDRYCQGKNAGDACVVEVSAVNDINKYTYKGICEMAVNRKFISYNKNDRVDISAQLVTCRTPDLEKPTMRKSSPPSFFDRLFE